MTDSEEATPEVTPEEAAQTPRQALLREIGRKLIEAREARGEQLSKVVRKLKLRQAHLAALESGDWDSLPDDVYALGFLRQYANYLSLDLNQEIQRLKSNDYALTRPLTFPDPPVAPSRRWAWIAALAFVVLFIAFNIFDLGMSLQPSISVQQPEQVETAESPMEEPAVDSTPADLAPPADEAPPPADVAPEETPEPEPMPEPVAEATPEPAPEAPAEPAPEPAAEAAVPAAAETGVRATEKPVEEQPAVVPAVLHNFRFEAVSDAVWMQVFLPDANGQKGELRKEVLLQSGKSFTINEAVDSLWITCGNPVALRISVDGQVVSEAGSLGSVGKVLRDYHFQINP